MPDAFNEDFFERVINVQWETEPKVLWLAGTGYPLIVNGALLNPNAWVFSSDNAHTWTGTYVGPHSYYDVGLVHGFGGFYGGGYMRENLTAGSQPVWVLMGLDGKFQGGSATISSKDGVFLHQSQYFDDRHFCWNFHINNYPIPPSPQNPVAQPGSVACFSLGTLNPDEEAFYSNDGTNWTPSNYFPRSSLDLAAVSTSIQKVGSSSPGCPAISITAPETQARQYALDLDKQLYLPVTETVGGPQPFASSPSDVAARTVFVQGTSPGFVRGRVRKGPFAGKVVNAVINPYDFREPAHGGPTIDIYNETITKKLMTVNCGLVRTACMNYGYYTFVVGGSSGGTAITGQKSTMAISNDLLTWHRIELGPHNQVNCLAVGPLKGALAPTGPTGLTGPVESLPFSITPAGPTGLSIP